MVLIMLCDGDKICQKMSELFRYKYFTENAISHPFIEDRKTGRPKDRKTENRLEAPWGIEAPQSSDTAMNMLMSTE